MAYDNNDKKMESVYSTRVKAGKRRTYFFDVRETRGNDYYVTITESRKRFDSEGYDRHKIFLYKEDFNKFLKGLNETVDHVKTQLMPDLILMRSTMILHMRAKRVALFLLKHQHRNLHLKLLMTLLQVIMEEMSKLTIGKIKLN